MSRFRGGRRRPIVVVLGMHRAGTSLCTRILNLMGVELGPNLFGANQWNIYGHWEPVTVLVTQDALLRELGRSWSSSFLLDPLPAAWWQLESIAEHKATLRQWLEENLAATDGLFGFKEPRTCRLIPLWLEIFRDLRVQPLWVITTRDPRAVAASLEARDKIPLPRSELLWMEHVLDPLRYLRPRDMCFVQYERWFTDPESQAEHLAAFLGQSRTGDTDGWRQIFREHVHEEGRHYSEAGRPYALDLTATVHEWLAKLEARGCSDRRRDIRLLYQSVRAGAEVQRQRCKTALDDSERTAEARYRELESQLAESRRRVGEITSAVNAQVAVSEDPASGVIAPPTITFLTPLSVSANQGVTLTVNGSNFQGGFAASLVVEGNTFPVSPAALTLVSSTQVRVVMFLGGPGPYTAILRITNPDGKSASAAFEVTAQRTASPIQGEPRGR